jgi:hypothetical protein
MKVNRAICLEPSTTEGGNLVGRDPRQMGSAVLSAAGFEPMTPMEVIRAKCLDCCGSAAQEVRLCVAVDCPSWPYRLGSNPFRAPLSEDAKASRGAALRRAHAARQASKITGLRRSEAAEGTPVAPEGGPAENGFCYSLGRESGEMGSRDHRGGGHDHGR